MAKRSKTRSARVEEEEATGHLRLLILRVMLWSVVVVATVAAAIGGVIGLRYAFFTGNPHFTLREVDLEVRGGALAQADVRGLLAAAGVDLNSTNLHRLDPGLVRRTLEKEVLIQRAEVQRVLPDRLRVRVWGRVPVAQLLSVRGMLVDEDGVLLPPALTPESIALPVITGVRGAPELEPGDRLASEAAQAALRFLHQLEMLPQGGWLDVRLVQLDRANDELRVYLRGDDERYLRSNTVMVLPQDDLKVALGRVLAIIAERSSHGQWISHVNATYDRVPVRP